ncbi:hypothetical protein R5R35_006473 [Gryllus longicercus]|uniref:Uncharacterized protein n=1 Tax=Gryllus longicercus TaxID=2509291 RepID=A0AAN9VDY2_9ORTH
MAENVENVGDADLRVLNAFQELAQGLQCVQEALRLQEQETERRTQEALQQHEERTTSALREAVSQFEQQLQEQDEAIRTLRIAVEERVQQVEERAALMEEHGGPSTRGGSEEMVDSEALQQLEARVEKLEEAIEKTLRWTPRAPAATAQATGNASQGNSHPEQANTTGGRGGETNQKSPGSLLGKRKK